jgi:hypothetical protein
MNHVIEGSNKSDPSSWVDDFIYAKNKLITA